MRYRSESVCVKSKLGDSFIPVRYDNVSLELIIGIDASSMRMDDAVSYLRDYESILRQISDYEFKMEEESRLLGNTDEIERFERIATEHLRYADIVRGTRVFLENEGDLAFEYAAIHYPASDSLVGCPGLESLTFL